jgi:hypothetical protein
MFATKVENSPTDTRRLAALVPDGGTKKEAALVAAFE